MEGIDEIKEEELLCWIRGHENIVIYGAGMLGQGLLCGLQICGLDKRIIGYAVSAHAQHLSEYMGIPIKEITEYDTANISLIIAVKERYLEGVLKNLGENVPYVYVGCAVIRKMLEKNGNGFDERVRQKLPELELSDEEFVTFCIKQIRRKQLDFEVNIADHCNLNCRCCNHFSPLAQPTFLDVKIFERDMMRLSELTKRNAGRIWLIGGEPLLHPEIDKFCLIARKAFPDADISIFTNGTLLERQKKGFWEVLRETHIELILTRYPISVDYDALNELMEREGVLYSYSLDSGEVLKTTYHLPLDLEGKLDGVANYIKCWHANECVTLRDGRIYTCPIAAHAHHFNKYFDEHLSESEANSISIYDVSDIEEILEFLKKPIPFCGHCNIDGYTYDMEWGISKRDIKEWT